MKRDEAFEALPTCTAPVDYPAIDEHGHLIGWDDALKQSCKLSPPLQI